MPLTQQLSEYIRAAFTGVWIESHEHQDALTEIAQLLINGAAIQSVAVELENIDAIQKAKELLGLTEYENINYLLAIKRVIGMEPLSI